MKLSLLYTDPVVSEGLLGNVVARFRRTDPRETAKKIIQQAYESKMNEIWEDPKTKDHVADRIDTSLKLLSSSEDLIKRVKDKIEERNEWEKKNEKQQGNRPFSGVTPEKEAEDSMKTRAKNMLNIVNNPRLTSNFVGMSSQAFKRALGGQPRT